MQEHVATARLKTVVCTVNEACRARGAEPSRHAMLRVRLSPRHLEARGVADCAGRVHLDIGVLILIMMLSMSCFVSEFMHSNSCLQGRVQYSPMDLDRKTPKILGCCKRSEARRRVRPQSEGGAPKGKIR